ncbi:MAG: tyrosine-type recombinase/integrase [Lentisphaeria bacterium]|nr:tyrosine-type recombinase/integrase [Lentisphaeria bacterium]
MGVRKRQLKGKETAEYHYEFMQNGKRYYGVCEGCTTKVAALAYEKKIKETAKKLAEQKSAGALVQNFKRELVGGDEVTLDNAFSIFERKPSKRSRSDKQMAAKRSYWGDFCAFIRAQYPDLVNLDQVTRQHAEEYINHLKTNGRFIRDIQNGKKASYTAVNSLSNTTINVYHKTLRSIFSKLSEDAGLLFNPFGFDMLENESANRDAFTTDELRLIGDNLNPFVRPIFTIGICTGLSEGDICLLKWSDINGNWISRKRKKTKVNLDIPIMPPLQNFLREQYAISGEHEYVLPDHAAMYLENPDGISYRVKKFLESIGIKTTRVFEGRQRATSVKDVHSLRHTFAYLAGCYQIPLPIVQSILGHMSPEMTKHYQAHADRKAKEKYLSQMPDFIGTTPVKQIDVQGSMTSVSGLRKQLKSLVDKMTATQLEQMYKLAIELQEGGING